MKKLLKIDKAIYEVDDEFKFYKFYSTNSNWRKLGEDENYQNKKLIEGYRKIMSDKIVPSKNIDKLYHELLSKPVNDLISNLSSSNATRKYQSSKALIEIAEKTPVKVYPFFDECVKLLENDNNIIKWTGIIILGNLSSVDVDKKMVKILPKLFALLDTGKMITAGNTAMALASIAKNNSVFSDKITKQLLKVEKYKYDTKECGNIVIGHVINAFDVYLEKPDKKVIEFISRALKNLRPATAKKAEKYLRSRLETSDLTKNS
jgi:hypothetical protein